MSGKLSVRLKEFERKPVEHIIYWISIWCFLVIGIVWIIAWSYAYRTGHSEIFDCGIKRVLGIPCPGCGGTRAVLSLFHGEIFRAVYYNAFVVFGAVWYLLFFFSQTLQRLSGGRVKGMQFHAAYMYVAVAVLMIQYVLKLLITGYVV